MELNRPAEASFLLDKIGRDNLNYSSARWHLAICYLMLDKSANAKEVLYALKKVDPVYNRGANRLLRAIIFRKDITIKVYNIDKQS